MESSCKSAFGFYGVFFRWNFATTVFFFSSGLTNPADFDFLLRLCSIKYPVVLVQSSGFSMVPNNPLDLSNHWICEIRWISPKSSGFVGKKKAGGLRLVSPTKHIMFFFPHRSSSDPAAAAWQRIKQRLLNQPAGSY